MTSTNASQTPGTSGSANTLQSSSTHMPSGIEHVRADLLQLIHDNCIVRGKVTLSSGIEADYYLDLRRASLEHRAAPLIGQVMIDVLCQAGWWDTLEAVGGLTMGADPIAVATMMEASRQGKNCDAFVVRKTTKTHGLNRPIEGPDVAGKKVVALEDTATTGGSVLQAIETLKTAGAEVIGAAVLMDRDTGARERIAEAGIPYVAAFSKDDLGL